MTEHIWAQEQIAAYIAGGLAAEEKERFEAHLRDCSECASELHRSRALDRGLESLFAPVRAPAALEDRMIHSLHVIKAVDVLRPRWKRNVLIGVAASVGLGLAGASMSAVARDGGLAFPGAGRLDFDMPTFTAVGNSVASPSEQAETVYGYKRSGKMEFGEINSEPNSPTQEGFFRTQNSDGQYLQFDGTSRESVARAGGGPGNGSPSRPGSDAAHNYFSGLDRDPSARAKSNPGQIPHEKERAIEKAARSGQNALVMESAGETGTPYRLFSPTEHRPSSDFDPKAEKGGQESDAEKGRAIGNADRKPPDRVAEKYKLKPNLKNTEVSPDAKLGDSSNSATSGNSNVGLTADSAPAQPAAPQKIIIRTGEVEFEIESFDSAVANVFRLVNAIKGGFVATVNSEKLANGKVKGSIVVRVPPEALDSLVLDLRRDLGKSGELKGQRIGSQDITKQFTDTESRLKAARTMETRLLQIIKDGKGEIKQLLEAERELGVWRTKIEEMEGELRYYANQVAFSTLTISLAEKEIRSAAGITESERVQTGIEVEDVEKAQQQLLAAVTEAKGRITKSEMKQLGSGQFNATVDFEVAPEQGGALRDRLRQLGVVTRLEIDRMQKAEGGTAQKDSKVSRGDTLFFVQLYNVARMGARETTTVQLASPDVALAFQSLKNAVLQVKGRILRANLDEQDRQNVNGTLDFEVKRADEPAIQTAIDAAGDVLSRVVSRSEENDSVTDAKVHFSMTLASGSRISPRASYSLGIEVGDVEKAMSVLASQVANARGRIIDSNVAQQRSGQVTGRLACTVPLAAAASLAEQFKGIGTVRATQVGNDLKAPDGKLALARIEVSLVNGETIVAKDNGLWPQVQKGLMYSANFLLVSLTWVIFGLCAVLPWAIVGYGGYRIIRWMARKPAESSRPA